uniref:Ribosomal protein S11 n=1 Tax=Timema douglasi TaxID=61478 RepID=A0A7R8VZF6_TIMDO|nr:unnamed protein product [Timema douglasi]
MLRKCSSLIGLIKNIENSSLHTNKHVLKENILLNVERLCSIDIAKSFHFALPRSKSEDRREMLASLPVKDEGTDGERAVDIDSLIKSREDMFPDERTPTTLFDGIPFQDMPICNIRVSPNNTIFTLSDAKGTIKMLRSCGIEGFKNARKGTNIAAQATAISISTVSRMFQDPITPVAGHSYLPPCKCRHISFELGLPHILLWWLHALSRNS